MEDHLRNKDRLQKEWEALCSYQADPCSVAVAQDPSNMDKNRHTESLPCEFINHFYCLSCLSRCHASTNHQSPCLIHEHKCTVLFHFHAFESFFLINSFSFSDDHSRVKLKTELNPNKQDYINASIIVRDT